MDEWVSTLFELLSPRDRRASQGPELLKALTRWHAAVLGRTFGAEEVSDPQVSQETYENLKALGYALDEK